MIKTLFTWLDANPVLYWGTASAAVLLLLAAMLRPMWRSAQGAPAQDSRWPVDLAIAATLLAWRWPFLLAAHQLNPDEAQQIAGAITLAHEPAFWRSVDGATAGPLNFYVLLLPHLFGAPLDFFFARLMGLVLVGGSLVILHRTLAREVGPAAMPATLAATLVLALTTDWNFIHYGSAHLPIFITTAAAALWWHARPGAPTHTLWRWAAAGFCAGLLPWAKLQAVPFAALFAGGALFLAFVRFRAFPRRALMELAVHAGGFLAPAAIILTLAAGQGVLRDFWLSYIARNFQYTAQGWELTFVLSEFVRLTAPLLVFPAFIAAIGLLVLAGMATSLFRHQRPSSFLIATSLLALTAIFVVFSPQRGFPHYLLFALIPFAAFAGAALHGVAIGSRAQRLGFPALLVVAAALLVARFALPAPFMIGKLSDHWRTPHSPLALKIQPFISPGDTIAVWDWKTEIYVHCALPQAVRDAHSQRQIESGPWQAYYRERYLADFRKSRPAFFIDAVGEGAFAYQDRLAFGHETFPELAKLIRSDYELAADEIHARLFLRRDRIRSQLVNP